MKETYFFLKFNVGIWILSSFIHIIQGSDKWFSRLCLASLFSCTFFIVKAIALKGDNK